MQWSNYVLDKYLAPRLSEYTEAEIPDVAGKTSQCEHWLKNYMLNSILRGSFSDRLRLFAFNFLRRAENAFREHALARDATEQFLAGSRQSVSHYMSALSHWESFLHQCWMALALLGRFAGVQRVFQPGEGSTEERLHALNNSVRHADSRIDEGRLPEDGTLAVWLTNRGLESVEHWLTWEETGELLETLAEWAGLLQDPIAFKEKVEALQQSSSASGEENDQP